MLLIIRIHSGPAVPWQCPPLKSFSSAERIRTVTEKFTSSTPTARLGSPSTQWISCVSPTSRSSSRIRFMWLVVTTIWAVKSMISERTSGVSYPLTIHSSATHSTRSRPQLRLLTRHLVELRESERKGRNHDWNILNDENNVIVI